MAKVNPHEIDGKAAIPRCGGSIDPRTMAAMGLRIHRPRRDVWDEPASGPSWQTV